MRAPSPRPSRSATCWWRQAICSPARRSARIWCAGRNGRATSVDPGFILQSAALSLDAAVAGTVARAPIVAGEPMTYAKIVRERRRRISWRRRSSRACAPFPFRSRWLRRRRRLHPAATTASISSSRRPSSDSPKRALSRIVLSDVRVLAIDQTSDGKNQKAVSDAKTATLELTPDQVKTLSRAQASGTLSLALRALGDKPTRKARRNGRGARTGEESDGDQVSIIRYGIDAYAKRRREELDAQNPSPALRCRGRAVRGCAAMAGAHAEQDGTAQVISVATHVGNGRSTSA